MVRTKSSVRIRSKSWLQLVQKGNLTGTPNGTGMHETGSSVTDTSSLTSGLVSSIGRPGFHSNYAGFYASPFPATGSITQIRDAPPVPPKNVTRGQVRSHPTIFLKGKDGMEENRGHKRATSTSQSAHTSSKSSPTPTCPPP